MKKIIRLSAAIVAGLLLAGVASISQGDIKIGFVDPVALIQNAPQSAAALKKLEKEFSPRNDDILELQDRMATLELDLEKNALIWAEVEIQNTKREIDALERRCLLYTSDAADE